MQAEKKELVTNELAKSLNRAYEGVRQGPSRGTVVFVAVALAAALIGVLFYWFLTSSSATDSQRWLSLDEAVFAEQLGGVIDSKEMKNSDQYWIARFKEARMKLANGLRDLGNNAAKLREDARKNIEESIEIYKELASRSSRSPQLQQEAVWGQAKGKEALGGRDNLDEALELYNRLAKEYPSSALGKDAKKQVERLESTSTKADLARIAEEFGTK